jgi:hypothetical protein
MTIKIRNPALELRAFIDDYWNDNLHESINKEFDFTFSAVIDQEKSQYIVIDNIVEVENNYFKIVYLQKKRNSDGTLTIDVDCEQVNQSVLNDPIYNMDSIAENGNPTAILTAILSGTGFTVGTVELTDVSTFSVQEASSRRSLLIQFANAIGGEYKFEKYVVHLLTRRGADNGNQFRVGKNLKGITVHQDKRSGTLKTAYDVDMVELSSLAEYGALEAIELGDTIRVTDSDLGVNEQQRIVEYDYSPKLKMNSRVTIANFIEGIENTISQIQRTTVYKEKLYFGTRIGPESGFETIRSDNKARSIMNANMIKLQKGDGTGNNWIDVIYLDGDGNAFFTGRIEASEFVGGSIAIGSGNNIFIADANGIYLGHVTFASAPFRVNMAGNLIATNADITGKVTSGEGAIGGWVVAADSIKDVAGTVGMLSTVTGGDDIRFFAGHATPSSAPFRVAESGALFASSATITGEINATSGTFSGTITATGEISGGTLTGALIRTGTSYPRIEFSSVGNLLAAYYDATHSMSIEPNIGGAPGIGFSDPSGLTGRIYGNSGLGMIALIDNIELTSLFGSIDLVAVNLLFNGTNIMTAINSKAATGSSTSSVAVADSHNHGFTTSDYIQCYDGAGVPTTLKQWVPYAGSAGHSHIM